MCYIPGSLAVSPKGSESGYQGGGLGIMGGGGGGAGAHHPLVFNAARHCLLTKRSARTSFNDRKDETFWITSSGSSDILSITLSGGRIMALDRKCLLHSTTVSRQDNHPCQASHQWQ
jgi:hypothetical protein